MSKYNKDSYSITGKKVCLVLVISKFDKKQYDRKNTENDYKLASEVLKSRGFEVILLVSHVTKKEFIKKLQEIRKRTDIGLFMLVVSSHGDENDNVMFSDSKWNNGKPRYARGGRGVLYYKKIKFVKESHHLHQYAWKPYYKTLDSCSKICSCVRKPYHKTPQ